MQGSAKLGYIARANCARPVGQKGRHQKVLMCAPCNAVRMARPLEELRSLPGQAFSILSSRHP